MFFLFLQRNGSSIHSATVVFAGDNIQVAAEGRDTRSKDLRALKGGCCGRPRRAQNADLSWSRFNTVGKLIAFKDFIQPVTATNINIVVYESKSARYWHSSSTVAAKKKQLKSFLIWVDHGPKKYLGDSIKTTCFCRNTAKSSVLCFSGLKICSK